MIENIQDFINLMQGKAKKRGFLKKVKGEYSWRLGAFNASVFACDDSFHNFLRIIKFTNLEDEFIQLIRDEFKKIPEDSISPRGNGA